MKFYWHLAFAISLVVSSSVFAQKRPTPHERKLYVGSNSTEALMTFRTEVQIKSDTKPTAAEVDEAIDRQVQHLFGTMATPSQQSIESGDAAKAVAKGDQTITGKTQPKKVAGTSNTWTVTYSFRDTIVLENRRPDRGTYDVLLPVNPASIYKQSKVGNSYPCTDEHYTSEDDFWYFWNPDQTGCELKEGEHFTRVTTTVKRLPNTKISYPEYKRLVDKNNEILAYVFFGMDKATHGKNPRTSADLNAKNFQAIRKYLLKKGYNGIKRTEEQVREIATTAIRVPYVEDLTKEVNGVKLVLRFFYGETGIDEESTAFHWFYKDALENSAIMIYGGHSGLGGHLELQDIENNLSATSGRAIRIRPNKSRYQIYYFDSCSSYPYYNKDYFARKSTDGDPRGSKNLDIFTNGLATFFSSMENSTNRIVEAVEIALESAFEGKEVVSYQTLAKSIDDDNLFGVNGDEDNPPLVGQ